MIPVNIALLKAKLSFYLGRVKAGEEVLVMDRSTPVAKLTPATGVGKGLVLIPRKKSPETLKRLKVVPTKRPTDVVKLLREERDRR